MSEPVKDNGKADPAASAGTANGPGPGDAPAAAAPGVLMTLVAYMIGCVVVAVVGLFLVLLVASAVLWFFGDLILPAIGAPVWVQWVVPIAAGLVLLLAVLAFKASGGK
jgi:hypothetical protein